MEAFIYEHGLFHVTLTMEANRRLKYRTPMPPIFTRAGDNRAALEVTLGDNGAVEGEEA